jgi:pantothenate kinase
MIEPIKGSQNGARAVRVVSFEQATTMLIAHAVGAGNDVAGQKAGRRLVALAGPPGSGKSTLAQILCARINAAGRRLTGSKAAHPPCPANQTDEPTQTSCMIVPMGGFHYDDAVLAARGLGMRKGAPDTFDVGGLAATLRRLRDNAEPEIAVPLFDRDLEISRAGARIIPRQIPLVLVEGNYLLLQRPTWSDLRVMFDVTLFIDVDEDELRRRLIDRWSRYGLGGDSLLSKLEGNDLPNARLTLAESAPADLRLIWPAAFSDAAPPPGQAS